MELCKAQLHIEGDFSSDQVTIICELHKGHSGSHRMGWPVGKTRAVVNFEVDDRVSGLPDRGENNG